VVVLRGWELGSAESLSMMILTGFAVDYVVHLSHAYMESDKSSRLERVHDALRDLVCAERPSTLTLTPTLTLTLTA
jgi:predicted RND superfamily exporter protein